MGGEMSNNNSWDSSYLWKKLGKVIRRPPSSQVNVQETSTAPSSAGATVNSGSSPPVLSSRDLLLISGAAAFGGALVVAAVYVTPLVLQKNRLQCPVCSCTCCAPHQRPVEAVKELLYRIGTSLNSGKERLGRLVGAIYRGEEPTESNNGTSWTCVQVLREDTTDPDGVVVSEAQAGATPLPDPYSPVKRKGYLSWDDYFMSIAFLSAERSKDPARQVGACLVSQDHVILGIGYNGFPRGCSDDKLPWAKKSKDGDVLKTKYPYVCHAEVNAILNKNHASAAGQRLYVTMFPCNECAKIIIQAGIAEVVFYTDKKARPDFQFDASRRLLSLANVKVRQHQPKAKSIVLEF